MAKKRAITCKRCGTSGLVWKQVDGLWTLFVGIHSGGSWEASDIRHRCPHEGVPKEREGDPTPRGDLYTPAPPAPTDLDPITCSCGMTVWVRPADVLRVGYPVCCGCQTFFEARAAVA